MLRSLRHASAQRTQPVVAIVLPGDRSMRTTTTTTTRARVLLTRGQESALRRGISSWTAVSCPVVRAAGSVKNPWTASNPSNQSKYLLATTKTTTRWYTPTGFLSKEYPPHTLFPMPALSPTMETGSISSWAIGEGDSFGAGDVLCAIDTDKASVDFEAQDDGVLAKILQQPGVEVAIGTPICVVVEEADDVPAFSDFVAPETEAAKPSPPSSDKAPAAAAPPPSGAEAATASPQPSSGGSPSFLMPSARHLAESKGLDATVLTGSGKGGRVTKADVQQAILAGTLPPLAAKTAAEAPAAGAASAQASAAPPTPVAAKSPPVDLTLPAIESDGGFEDLPNNKMRKIIASRLTESKRDVPHFYTSAQILLDPILALRKELVQNHEVKVSVNDFVLRCCALSLRDVPEVNATYNTSTDTVTPQSNVDVSVAVATPTGLITPIIFGADQLGLQQITEKVRDLAGRARDGKLSPEEYQGGTFSVSNLGMFGIDEFSAVINPPQAAILAVGGGSRRIVPTPYVDGAEEQPKPGIQTLMTARLSADRRVVDEATAGLFMSAFTHYMNEPKLMLL